MEEVRIPLPSSPTKFLDQLRAFMRTDGKKYSTENTYVYWVKQFILFHNKAHPKSLGCSEGESFLTHLSLTKDASPNTQKLALNALMFLYNRFLNTPIGAAQLQIRESKLELLLFSVMKKQ